jgi:hypothetical protein
MQALMCKLCGQHHYRYEPHRFPALAGAGRTASAATNQLAPAESPTRRTQDMESLPPEEPATEQPAIEIASRTPGTPGTAPLPLTIDGQEVMTGERFEIPLSDDPPNTEHGIYKVTVPKPDQLGPEQYPYVYQKSCSGDGVPSVINAPPKPRKEVMPHRPQGFPGPDNATAPVKAGADSSPSTYSREQNTILQPWDGITLPAPPLSLAALDDTALHSLRNLVMAEWMKRKRAKAKE